MFLFMCMWHYNHVPCELLYTYVYNIASHVFIIHKNTILFSNEGSREINRVVDANYYASKLYVQKIGSSANVYLCSWCLCAYAAFSLIVTINNLVCVSDRTGNF